MPQNAYNVNELGMARNEGPALLMTKEDHALTRTYRGNYICADFIAMGLVKEARRGGMDFYSEYVEIDMKEG